MTADEHENAPLPASRGSNATRAEDSATGVVKDHTVRLAPTPQAPSQGLSTDRRPGSGDTFVKDQVVGGRYRIIRFIAKGGMGEVYEAEDLEFSTARSNVIERVALKTVRMDMAGYDDSIQRFRLEILHSRKIAHPNVSRIFESGRHRIDPQTPGGLPIEILFFTMELLQGETLRERIRRLGKMTTAQALPLVAQMAGGLATAHAAGVVHRDFKSSNVFIVPGPAGERAVVTDFGLARGEVDESSLASLTGTGDTLGTLAYMAPEQFGRSKGVPPTADIYALGVVMYEMVTADVPFADMVKKLSERAASPKVLTPNLDPVWDKTILRCLEKNPEDRFQSATDVVRALGGQPVAIGRNTERRMLMGAGIAVVLALGGGYYAAKGSAPSGEPPVAAPGVVVPAPKSVAIRGSVAVLGFQPPLGETGIRWLSPALTELISGGLAAGNQLRVVPTLQSAQVRNAVGVKDLGAPGADQLLKLGQALPAASIVSGAYSFIGSGPDRVLRLEMNVHSPMGGPTQSWMVSGSEKEIADLALRGAETLREKLGAPRLLPGQQKDVSAFLPSDPVARQNYAESLEHLGGGDAVAARVLLERAVRSDPRHPAVHAALATTWSLLGDQPKAAAAAARALSAGASLPSDQRLLLEARSHEIDRDWKAATASYTSLRATFPDDPEYLVPLVDAQVFGGKSKDALATIEDFRKLPESVSGDPRVDLAEARVYARLGDNKEALAAAARASLKGSALGLARLMANAKLLESVTLDALGESDRSLAASEEARRLFENAGDRHGMAKVLHRLGASLQRKRGDPAASIQVLDSALALFREVGDRLGEARVLFNIGAALFDQGRVGEAAKKADEALVLARQIGAKAEAASSLNNLGSVLILHGDLGGAQSRYQQALGLYTEIGDKRLTALTLTNLGEVLLARGDLKKSRDSHEEALGINRQLGDAGGAAYDTYRIGEVLVQTGDLNAAEGRYRESIKGQTEAGVAAETRLRLAALLVDTSRAKEGEKEAREAEETLRVDGLSDLALWAQIVVVDAERSQGKLKEAKADLAKVLPLVEKSGDGRVKHAALLAHARLAAAGQEKGEASIVMPLVQAAQAAAAKAGRVVDEFESRLVAAELDLALGQSTARSRLAKLVADARARGLEGVARKAEAKIR